MSNPAPTPIKDGTPVINEAELNNFPAWQRALRRKQLEAQAQQAIDSAKREAEDLKRKVETAARLRQALVDCGLDIPASAEVDTSSKEPVIHYEGYRWSYDHTDSSRYSPKVYIAKSVPEALTVEQLEELHEEWYELADYRLAVSDSVGFNPVYIANALDKLDEEAERRRNANEIALSVIKSQSKPADVGTMPALSADTPSPIAETAAGAAETRTEQHYDTFALNADGASCLQAMLDDGWEIAHEQFLWTDGVEHCVRFTREVPLDAPEPTKEASQVEADTDTELSKFDAALLEITGEDAEGEESTEEAEPVPVAEPADIIYHVDEPTDPILDELLKGKPIAQSIAQNGLEATRQAMNAAIAQKVLGADGDTHYEPLTSLSERIKAMRVLAAEIEVQS